METRSLLKRVFNPALTLALSVGFLCHFWCIWEFGNLQIQEPNQYVLAAEITALLGIFLFGVETAIDTIEEDEFWEKGRKIAG